MTKGHRRRLQLGWAISLATVLVLPPPLDASTRLPLDRLPLYFVENRGQTDAGVAYYVSGRDASVYFTQGGLAYVLAAPGGSPAKSWSLKLDFVDANPGARPVGQELTAAVFSYFRGPRESWKAGLPTFATVAYRELWPGIDLVYTGAEGRLKYTFVVQPGADPARIRLAYRGAHRVEATREGRLKLWTPVRSFEEEQPYAYQEVGGQRVEVAADYTLDEDASSGRRQFGFRLGDYDRCRPLILDPVVFSYMGFIGGAGDDQGLGIAVDGTGAVYVSGPTTSTDATFPDTVGAFDRTLGGTQDAFVAKVNAAGTGLVYCTFLGGSSLDSPAGLAVDGSGNAYVVGYTDSADFPVAGPLGPALNGAEDAFVTKLGSTGASLVYSGFVGGPGTDAALAIAVDGSGRAYVAGDASPGFPVTTGPAFGGGFFDAFAGRVNAAGTAFEYARFIGGSGFEEANGLAIDGSGNAYVVGYTDSVNFPAVVGPDLTLSGGTDAYVTKINASAAVVYSGFIGGAMAGDIAFAVAVDGSGRAHVTGRTDSTEATGFPVTVGPDLTFNGGGFDAFVTRVRADGTGFEYAGFVGGAGSDEVRGIAVRANSAYLSGFTDSPTGFPVLEGPSVSFGGGGQDGFVARVKADGSGLVWSGFIGGASADNAFGVAVDASTHVYVAGSTSSTESSLPVRVGPDLSYNGGASDAFVAKLDEGCPELTATKAGTTITVAAPSFFEMVFDTAAGGSMERFHDLAEDPTRTYDLVGALSSSNSPRGLHNAGMNVSGAIYNAGVNTSGSRLDLLEATPSRVKLRQESFYQNGPAGPILPGVRGLGDYSISPAGRVALSWSRKANAAVTYNTEFHETTMHRLGAGPLSGWTVYFQAAGAGAGTGNDVFSLAQSEGAGVRTDFLHIFARDWSTANGHLATADLTDRTVNLAAERVNAYWVDTPGTTVPAGSSESWSFLTYFKPTSFLDHTDPAVTSRSADYRGPDVLTINAGKGARWVDAAENTSLANDWFNEAEAAYVLDLNPALGLDFDLDGTVPGPRYKPFFKIRQWRSLLEPATVTTSGATRTRGLDYTADVKPVARAHFAQDLLWHSTLHNAAA